VAALIRFSCCAHTTASELVPGLQSSSFT
jgi:hypothetical protein